MTGSSRATMMDQFVSDSEEGEDSTELKAGLDGSRSTSGDSIKEGGKGLGDRDSPKKRPRITLPRGRACVTCRQRKLKCSGDRPCKTCEKAQIECRFEEIQKRKPRNLLLEERVSELEAILVLRGESLPPTQLTGIPPHPILTYPYPLPPPPPTYSRRSTTTGSGITPPDVANHPRSLTAHSHPDLPPDTPTSDTVKADIIPNSSLELALITIVLPHTPYLLMPVHPQRFLALLTLSPTDSLRPHPALLYIMFAEAVRILENNIPTLTLPRRPSSLFPHSLTPPMPDPPSDPAFILQHVRGMSLPFLERARTELDAGIRDVDRPFDLIRAAVGIARHLYGLGRFIEGWTIPVSRLLISCGLHRQTGIIIPPDDSPDGMSALPKPYAPSHTYLHSHSNGSGPTGEQRALPILRMRPVIIPPPRDEIELAERVMTFWSAKTQDWEAGTGWGWTLSLSDEECTTQWPWGWGGVEAPPALHGHHFAIEDLYDPSSLLHSCPYPDTTYTLALKSLGLLHRASHLFDIPVSSYPTPGTPRPSHIPPLSAVQTVDTALKLFRRSIPMPFQDVPDTRPEVNGQVYDGPADPWWIMLHANLYTAEMLMWKEMSHYDRASYQGAVSYARAIVGLVRSVMPDQWAHVDMIVALDLSLAARFLNKESERLGVVGEVQAAGLAADEAEELRLCLARDYGKWLPMASLHGLIVQRVREGWPEKQGEYERL